jgi:hypothetical protein
MSRVAGPEFLAADSRQEHLVVTRATEPVQGDRGRIGDGVVEVGAEHIEIALGVNVDLDFAQSDLIKSEGLSTRIAEIVGCDLELLG